MDDTKMECGLQTAKEGQGKRQQSQQEKRENNMTHFFFFPFTVNTPASG